MFGDSLTSIKQIHNSLAMGKYLYKKILWAILVEGETDRAFYSRFSKYITIICGTPEGDAKTIPEWVRNGIQDGKHIFGIIDADYKKPTITNDLFEYIKITDAHSLETMIIKHIGIKKFDKIITSRLRYLPKSDITETVLNWAYKIGYLRYYSMNNNKRWPFKSIRENSTNYKDFISLEIDQETKSSKPSFNFNEFLNSLNIQLESDTHKTLIDFNLNKAWNICQGHDIFIFFDTLNRLLSNGRETFLHISDVPTWEYDILKKCPKSKFENTEFYAFFIDNNNNYIQEKKKINSIIDYLETLNPESFLGDNPKKRDWYKLLIIEKLVLWLKDLLNKQDSEESDFIKKELKENNINITDFLLWSDDYVRRFTELIYEESLQKTSN